MEFNQSGQNADLEAAILLFQDALTLLPICDSDHLTMLYNLAVALRMRFEWAAQCKDLEEAISLH